MYPRNAASPERIAVGPVYLIADGSPVDADVLVRVMPQGGAAAAGLGTLAVDATSHIWHYTPTQAETNYTSFMVMIYKAACTSASAYIVTTASSVPGTVEVEAVLDGAIGADAVADIFSTTTIAEAYAADGAAGTPAQLIYEILQSLTEFAVVGTTITVKKRDGSTTAATFTLNSATIPTSRTRAS